MRRRRLEVAAGVHLDVDHLDAEGAEDVAVGRVAGARQRHPVAGVEGGEEGEHEGAGRAGGNDDPPPVDVDALPAAVVGGDGLAQRRVAESVGVAEPVPAQRPRRGGAHAARRRSRRLADLQVEDVVPAGCALVGGAQHVHDDERGRWRSAAMP